MPAELFWWGAGVFSTFCGLLIMYLFSYRLFDQKFSIIWTTFLKKHMIGLVLVSFVLGTMLNYIGDSDIMNFSLIFVSFLMITLLHRKREDLKFYELIILFLLVFLVFGVLETFILILLLPFSLPMLVMFYLANLIHIIVISFLYRFSFFTKLYRLVAANLVLQLLMTIIVLLAFGVSFFVNFEFSAGHFVFSIILMGFVVVAFSQLIPILYFYTKQLPRLYHDRNTRLMAHHARIYSESECEKAKLAVDEMVTEARLEPKVNHYIVGEHQNNIQVYIDNKLEQRQAQIDFATEIHYGAPHQTVSLDELLYMTGTLIDNAIESGRRNYPAYLIISCIKDHLLIKQTNATLSLITEGEVEKMVQAGISTKARYGRGYGLYNLKERLEKEYGGHLQISSFYNKVQESNYIEFIINVNAYTKTQ